MAQPRSMAVAAVNSAPSTVESKKTHPELGNKRHSAVCEVRILESSQGQGYINQQYIIA
jgi:hypothetical protein